MQNLQFRLGANLADSADRRSALQVLSSVRNGTTSALVPAMEKSRDLKVRSFQFVLKVVSFSRSVRARDVSLRGVADQLVAAAGSVGANLEEAAAGQSKADFIAKTCIALKEARESRYWLRVIAGSCPTLAVEAEVLDGESSELVAMLTAAINTARRNALLTSSNRGGPRA